MTATKSSTKGIEKGRAESGEGEAGAEIVSAILALAYPTDEARRDAEWGVRLTGSTLETILDLADEVGVTIIHPEVLSAALPVILRRARASYRATRPAPSRSPGSSC